MPADSLAIAAGLPRAFSCSFYQLAFLIPSVIQYPGYPDLLAMFYSEAALVLLNEHGEDQQSTAR